MKGQVRFCVRKAFYINHRNVGNSEFVLSENTKPSWIFSFTYQDNQKTFPK